MGNQLVGIAPSQIFPVERYLTDHPELKFEKSLGSTRFFKVARAESQEGLVVVKVFAIHDPSLPLATYKDRLEEIRKKLSTALNCSPFQKILVTDKAALIMRGYVKYTLYDRMSTRPFLTNIEKRWITFQILLALSQCHKNNVCHGDIKLENITVTSWNWVLLVDFASFKPTFLPEDNPADYSYFFDTSRRRTCYIAPERFTKAASTENSALITETTCDSGELTYQMDIFSTGCALLELWSELNAPFEYSQLLAYRIGKYSPQKHLDKLEDPRLKSMISSMIDLDPSKRKSAVNYLNDNKGKFFPKYFFDFLQPYMLMYSSSPILSPDEKIIKVKPDISNMIKLLGTKQNQESDEKGDVEKNTEELKHENNEALVLVVSLVTSCIRGLHDTENKLQSLEILLELARNVSDETILDRILPYIMYLLRDCSCEVKISAVDTVTQCLNMVKHLPRSDSNIFPEYVLPGLAPLATDPNTRVRAAYAKNIAALAETALRYLDQIQDDWYDNSTNKQNGHHFNYELELQALHEMIGHTVIGLLTDSQALVKQTLIESGVAKLCVFFGHHKAYDVLLSHMITFLNDKDDKELRGSFYDCVVGVAAFIGWHCSDILDPLLSQGLTDSCEFITARSINATSYLAELGLLTKSQICKYLNECAAFLVHPNLWIRQAMVGFITTTTKVLSLLDVQCKVMPEIRPFMKYQLIQIDKPELLLESLVPPIPRAIFDSVLDFKEFDMIMSMLVDKRDREQALSSNIRRSKSAPEDWPSSIKNLFRRLEAFGMSTECESYFLRMSQLLGKIHSYRHNSAIKPIQSNGRIELNSITSGVKSHTFYLKDNKSDFTADRRLHRTNTSGSIDTNINSDWNFSTEMLTRHSESTNSGGLSSRSTSSRPSSPPPDAIHTPFNSTDPSSNISLHERSYIQYKRSSCYVELDKLKCVQREHYNKVLRAREYAEQAAWLPRLPPPEWSVRGALVAHLHEHSAAITGLCNFPDKSYFASCSSDGYVRLWDCAKMEGKNIANRSRQHFKMHDCTSMTVCGHGEYIVVGGKDGAINVLKLDAGAAKMPLVQSRQLKLDEEGFCLQLETLETGFQNLVVYATSYGSVVGWDLRSNETAWKMQTPLPKGFVSAACVDSSQSILTVGTNQGHYRVFDLRFQLPINNFDLPNNIFNSDGRVIRSIIPHPTEKSWVMSGVDNHNKIVMYNLESKNLEKVLWGTTISPFSPELSTKTGQVQPPVDAYYSLLSGTIDRTPFVLSAGTDQRVTFWNLDEPEKSRIAIPAADDPASASSISFQSRFIHGIPVICQTNPPSEKFRENAEETPKGGPDQPSAGHLDCITKMTLCKASQCYLVTAGRDGVIKVFK